MSHLPEFPPTIVVEVVVRSSFFVFRIHQGIHHEERQKSLSKKDTAFAKMHNNKTFDTDG